MKEEDLREGIWYKVSGLGYGPYDYIRIYDIDENISYSEAVSGGVYVWRNPSHTILQKPYTLTPMTESQKVEYLPQYQTNKLGWCRTEVRGYYIFVTGIGNRKVEYSKYISENTYYEDIVRYWDIDYEQYVCPLTEDEIEEFITPYLPKDRGLHVPEASFIYDENDQDSICDMCERNLDTNRGTCEGSKCEQAKEMFYEEIDANIDHALKIYKPGMLVENLYTHEPPFTVELGDLVQADGQDLYIEKSGKKLWLFEGGVWADIVADEPTETDLEKAKRLYPIGTKYISPENGKTYYVEKAPYGDQYWINAKGDICADTGVNEGEFIFYQGKWAEIIEPQKLDMTGLPDAHIENLHNSVKEFLVDTTSVASYDQSRFVPVGEPYMGYLSGSQKAGLKGQQRVPTMLGGKGVINVDELRAQAKEMNLLSIDSERVAGMHNPPISLYDGLNWMLPTDKKRGSEIIEIFIKK